MNRWSALIKIVTVRLLGEDFYKWYLQYFGSIVLLGAIVLTVSIVFNLDVIVRISDNVGRMFSGATKTDVVFVNRIPRYSVAGEALELRVAVVDRKNPIKRVFPEETEIGLTDTAKKYAEGFTKKVQNPDPVIFHNPHLAAETYYLAAEYFPKDPKFEYARSDIGVVTAYEFDNFADRMRSTENWAVKTLAGSVPSDRETSNIGFGNITPFQGRMWLSSSGRKSLQETPLAWYKRPIGFPIMLIISVRQTGPQMGLVIAVGDRLVMIIQKKAKVVSLSTQLEIEHEQQLDLPVDIFGDGSPHEFVLTVAKKDEDHPNEYRLTVEVLGSGGKAETGITSNSEVPGKVFIGIGAANETAGAEVLSFKACEYR